MGQVFKATLTYEYVVDGVSHKKQTINLIEPVNATTAISGVQNIGFGAAEEIQAGEAPGMTGGWVVLQNLDDTNFVDVYQDSGTESIIRLNAGEFAAFRMNPDIGTLEAKADTAAVDVAFFRIPA